MKRTVLFLVVLQVMVGICGTAVADDETDAKEAFAQGRAYFVAKEYEKALAALTKAYSLKPHPALLRYMGDTCFKMNRAQAALEFYQKYLAEAPQAVDRDRVQEKVQELEKIIGEKPSTEPPPQPAQPAQATGPEAADPATANEDTETPDALAPPTGEDREVPQELGLAQAPAMDFSPTGETPAEPEDGGTSTMTILKWVSLGLGIGGLGMGIAFNRMAASDAQELEDAVKAENPEMDNPPDGFRYAAEHHDLQQSYQNNNTLSTASFVAGGAFAAAAVVLFIWDSGDEERPPSRANVAFSPVVGAGTLGLAGGVSF